MDKLTLRLRITILVGIIIVSIAVLLTAASIRGANNYFVGTELHKTIVNKQETNQWIENALLEDGVDGGNNSNLDVNVQIIDAQKKFTTQSIIIMMAIIIAGVGFTYMIVGKALRPLTDLSEKIKDINDRNLSKSINVLYTKDEVGSLSTSFNSMLNRLDSSFARQKKFAANAAHELKTPLATIKTSLQVLNLDENPTPEDYKANAEAIQQSTERLIKVVDGLLELAFEDRTDFDDVLSLKSVFGDIAKELKSLAEENNVSIVIQESDCQLQCNKNLLYRAIYNLVANAVKYNKKDGRIELSAKQESDSVIITVRDHGVGISEDEISNIFEPFYRVDKSKSQKVGSGLGLSLVKTIIDKHDGTIEIRSIEGVGTTVDVTLPVRC